MGITIHFKGKIKSPDLLPQLIEEAKDIAVANNWKHHIFEKELPKESYGKVDFNDTLYGISFTPPKCEPVSFTFLSNGNLCSVVGIKMYFEYEQDETFISWNSFKTQYAGPEIHKILILIIDYFSKKYLIDVEVIDEADFWDTRDETILNQKFEFLGGLINSFGSQFEFVPQRDGESFEEYLKRIANNIKKG